MPLTIVHKKNATAGNPAAPLPADLVLGQIGINSFTGTAYTKKEDGTVSALGGSGGMSATVAEPLIAGGANITASPTVLIVTDGANTFALQLADLITGGNASTVGGQILAAGGA